MCEFTGASCRLGTIVESRNDTGDRSHLTVSIAQDIGRQINSRLKQYLNSSSDAIRESVNQKGRGIGFTKIDVTQCGGDIRARFDPGLILDFPKIRLTAANGKKIEIRSCVTVCVGALRSKLWTRANTIGEWGKISKEELGQIHSLLESICEKVNEQIKNNYKKDFSSMTAITSISTHGNIHVFAADCSGDGVSENIDNLYSHIQAKHGKVRSIENLELAEALRNVIGISIHGETKEKSNKSYALADGEEFFPVRSEVGVRSVFVQSTREKDAYFAGIVDAKRSVDLNSEQSVKEQKSDSIFMPNGVGATAELAAYFGGAF